MSKKTKNNFIKNTRNSKGKWTIRKRGMNLNNKNNDNYSLSYRK